MGDVRVEPEIGMRLWLINDTVLVGMGLAKGVEPGCSGQDCMAGMFGTFIAVGSSL